MVIRSKKSTLRGSRCEYGTEDLFKTLGLFRSEGGWIPLFSSCMSTIGSVESRVLGWGRLVGEIFVTGWSTFGKGSEGRVVILDKEPLKSDSFLSFASTLLEPGELLALLGMPELDAPWKVGVDEEEPSRAPIFLKFFCLASSAAKLVAEYLSINIFGGDLEGGVGVREPPRGLRGISLSCGDRDAAR